MVSAHVSLCQNCGVKKSFEVDHLALDRHPLAQVTISPIQSFRRMAGISRSAIITRTTLFWVMAAASDSIT